MKPKDITIGGRPYTARPMRPAEAVHGAVLRAREGRNVYRIVGLDGAEAILRNVRRPDGFVAWDASRLTEDFLIVEAPSPPSPRESHLLRGGKGCPPARSLAPEVTDCPR